MAVKRPQSRQLLHGTRTPMHEVELKLQVPPESRDAVMRAVTRGRATRTHLHARYFDTPDRRLAAAGLAARVRREGRQWVQAAKGVGDGLMQRLEHEVPLGSVRGAAGRFDVSRHRGTPVGDAMSQALAGRDAALGLRFETDVWRTQRELRVAGVRLAVAFDEGVLRAGERTLPVCELELELRGGAAAGLVETAARWAERHGLWLDVRSKAERGHWLADACGAAPVAKPVPPRISRQAAPAAALRDCVRSALAQVLANASWLAAGHGRPEHVHQARVGLRRLTSVLREFGDWSDHAQAAWSEGARSVFASLSATRDRDALAQWLWPALRDAGAPVLDLDRTLDSCDPVALFRSSEVTLWALQLLAFVHQLPSLDSAGDVRALARPRLARLHRQAQRAGQHFATLDDAERHRARKRLKRLRYCAESLSALWPAKSWQEYSKRLRNAQEALGRLQDAVTAEDLLHADVQRDCGAAFACGWLAARHEGFVADAGHALRALGAVPEFLRRANAPAGAAHLRKMRPP
jgi:inorganic triphosphatase YgiF